MAEAFLQLVLENLSSLIQEEIGLIMGVDGEMKKLSSTLTAIQAVLEDAEEKQLESRSIRDWLRKVNGLAYEIDDILDDCNTHVSKLNHSGSKLSRYSLQKILHRHKVGRRMKQATERLDSVAAERTKFHLREMPVAKPREVAGSRETGSVLNESDTIYGRDEDRESIVKVLVEDAREKQEMPVLPIVGVGGLGKTTLARLVFNDPRVVDHFDLRIWVCVSDDFEMKTLVKAMIESVTRSEKASGLQHMDALVHCLSELLYQKRYLLVLDDVWNDQQEKWCELKGILSCGSTGASIVVTTRQKKVAAIMGTLPPHFPKKLSDEHCWMLLRQRAFGPQEHVCPELEIIGKQIVIKCAGVPLAAKALGGILRFKRAEKEWIYVRESEIWKLSQEDSLIMPALRLSYHHLPLELKQCFAYFAAFPKDYTIEKEELVLMWMAHGFISSRGTLQAEDVGNEICNELLLRSLLQPIGDDLIGMHDLVHDLAESVMENKVPGLKIASTVTTSASTIRQVNFLSRNVSFPKTFQQDMNIYSILAFPSLRVLDASDAQILKHLPPSIGNLKHLRYLNLRASEIRSLPNSLCTLWNLQILNLDYCTKLVALPKNMRDLRNLRHLCLLHCRSLSEMPSKMRELTLLKTLSTFVVGHNTGKQLEELQCLNLSGRLEILHLERVKDHMDAKKANLVKKMNLRDLILSWERNNLSTFGEDADEKVLEALEPHKNIETLHIRGFQGKYFPLWMSNSTLGKIVEIHIIDCQNCRRLPKLGELPHLKRLLLSNIGVEYIVEDIVGSGSGSGKPVEIQFVALEKLELSCLPNLKGLFKETESKEAFSNLKHLRLEGCSSLTLPVPPLSSLNTLDYLTCSISTLAFFSELDSLTRLHVMIEESTTCFPIETLEKFCNLRTLIISGAKEISMMGKGIQAIKNLKYLRIQDCKTMRCIPEEFLRQLSALQSLHVWSCPEFEELSEEIKHLQKLRWIQLFNLPKLAGLPQALQHLPSFGRLFLSELPQLETLPDCLDQLTCLRVLDCPKVVSLPSLPNIYQLRVSGCPELERRCQRGTGEYWHKIAHIPYLGIAH